ncbi:3,4-dihydroxy-2-butanone-4-phosphate synthase [Buchnera aphidicola]|uniref:3,4-dihydroxy-2-butanone-4-phosphate synthase n=1 Tax=Buchnera aphidicola TaxID=9 RepID=UPI003464B400
MVNYLTKKFGNAKNRIQNAMNALKKKQGVIIIDHKNRENEGDLVFYPNNMTVQQMALSIRYGSGIVCLCITEKKRKQLNLPMMVKKNTSTYKTGFTISIEAATKISTGVSAKDRLQTIKTAISDTVTPSDIKTPGHVFPLCAHRGGVLSREGHTEASIALMALSGLQPMSVICELMNKDGSMANIKEIIKFSQLHNMPILKINDIITYIKKKNHKNLF